METALCRTAWDLSYWPGNLKLRRPRHKVRRGGSPLWGLSPSKLYSVRRVNPNSLSPMCSGGRT